MTFDEAAQALSNFARLMHPPTKRDEQIQKTLGWVRDSCREDGLPEHIIALVTSRVLDEMMVGVFPLLE
jgi:hypothetical protein